MEKECAEVEDKYINRNYNEDLKKLKKKRKSDWRFRRRRNK